jgi:hypothetical protein
MKLNFSFLLTLVSIIAVVTGYAAQSPSLVTLSKDGKLDYVADETGNRVPDFSHAGYGGGGIPLPDVPARLVLKPVAGDSTGRIQAALDQVSAHAPDARGLRGAVVLAKGNYEIAGQLRITASGVVLRGEGQGIDGTVLVATGWERRALIEISGRADRKSTGPAVAVLDEYVPVGATKLRVANTSGLSAGMTVSLERPSPPAWLSALGMDVAPGRQPYEWKPGTVNIRWDRVITAVAGNAITLDAPLTTALEKKFGGATITPFEQFGYLRNVGVENLRCVSAYEVANPLDEQHAWNAIDLHAVCDGWVSDVTALHFSGTVVQLGAKTARITVQDCHALEPISELGGYRRMPFHVRGQQALFLRCTSEQARHDFSAGYLAAGPNVFLECTSRESHSFSGSIGAWASGLLFDNVVIDGGALRLDNLETWNQGVGWAAANSMLWQCSASTIICRTPPGAANWADAVWGQFVGNGRWSRVNEFATPTSLYRAQLADRLGEKALEALAVRTYPPTGDNVPLFNFTPPPPAAPLPSKPLALKNSWLTANDALLTGQQIGTAWWLGRLESARSAEFGPALTRFSPGRAGTGNTDEIPSVVANMAATGQVAFRHHWGLWYDRRRIDHEMIRRPDSEVYPPFYEMPWARSGQGTAWDGLSRYDLTKFNPWYFGRLKQFANEARRVGVVLVNAMYFQHNIIESGAHWVDFPWRPVNNLQATNFVEPPPFKGDTINVAAAFYDVTDPQKRDLHRRFIRHSLDTLADEPNVIHLIGDEYSGPLHFMQFWVDVVAEWKRETGKSPLIGLSACKDVQDAILADQTRSAVIDVIDFKYWFRTDKGEEFAPSGGTDAAPRQQLRKWKGGRPSAKSIAAMVAEYRERFPGKAIISDLDEAEGWSFVAAGGSFAKLPSTTNSRLLAALAQMKPVKTQDSRWSILQSAAGEAFFHAVGADLGELDMASTSGKFVLREIDLKTGKVMSEKPIDGSVKISSGLPPSAFWIARIP